MTYRVYTDPYHPKEQTLKGLKGPSFLDIGYVYAPYVPSEPTNARTHRRLRKAGLRVVPRVNITADDFKPRAGILTRYSSKQVSSELYGRVKITE